MERIPQLSWLFQSLWLWAQDNHTVVYTAKPTTTTKESSFKEISEAKAKNLWLLPYNAFGQFLHTKLKTHLKNIATFPGSSHPCAPNTVIQTGLTASPQASCLGLQDWAFISVSLFQADDGTQQDLLLHKWFTGMVLSSPNAACYLRTEQAAPSLRNEFLKSMSRKAAALHTSSPYDQQHHGHSPSLGSERLQTSCKKTSH